MSEMRAILAEQADRLLTDLVTKDVLERAERGEWPDALWRALEENGLTRALVPEDQGGAGLNWDDAYELLYAAGRHAAPVPLAETMLAGWLLSQAGLPVPEGPLTVAPARRGETLTLGRAEGDAWLSGEATRVPWGGRAGHVVAIVGTDAGLRVALARREDATIVPNQNIAAEPRDALRFQNAPAVAAPAGNALPADAVQRYGALVRAAQMAGALIRLLELSVGYANDRVQFGRPIGKFQAIQQQLAVLAGEAAAAGMAAETACRAAARGDGLFEIAAAKLRAGDAAGIACAIAHQVHGAIGFTHEHALHFSTRRLWSWRDEFGSEHHWAEAIGREVAARGANALWPWLTER